jgi:hypothetical protein
VPCLDHAYSVASPSIRSGMKICKKVEKGERERERATQRERWWWWWFSRGRVKGERERETQRERGGGGGGGGGGGVQSGRWGGKGGIPSLGTFLCGKLDDS